ncbi:uncharacterized protein LOC126677518 [Mercurialis annua]|uniref:uncharacterized protein LOC126677518 n=1 Tax=Mercurialis annua TaxID=3986 RepID=UPI0021609301|nr:uncharacterized protein LOC126677518 [Mercurialis annua]
MTNVLGLILVVPRGGTRGEQGRQSPLAASQRLFLVVSLPPNHFSIIFFYNCPDRSLLQSTTVFLLSSSPLFIHQPFSHSLPLLSSLSDSDTGCTYKLGQSSLDSEKIVTRISSIPSLDSYW